MSGTNEWKPASKDRLRRLERISERDPLRRFPNFDADRVRKMEDKEISTNPEGFKRRHQNEGLDRATQWEVDQSLRKKKGPSRG